MHPDLRSQGVGSQLFDVAADYAKELGIASVLVYATDDDHTRRFMTQRGFVEASRTVCSHMNPAMVAPLSAPDAVTLRPFRDLDDLKPVFLLDVETALDEPGPFDSSAAKFDAWLADHSIGPDFDAELALVAEVEGLLVGLATLYVNHDARTAMHSGTGVRAEFRGRGIARALKHSLLNRAAEHGITRVFTVNDTTNGPIRHLNDSFGFVPFTRRIAWVSS